MPNHASLPAARKNAVGSTLVGTARIYMRRMVTAEAVLAHLDLLLTAMRQYRMLVNANMARLAAQLGVDLSEFADDDSWHKHEQIGHLRASGEGSDETAWRYFFHGGECQFTNEASGVSVEAIFGFGPACGSDFALFDVGFFLHFLETSAAASSQFRPLASLFRDWYDNVATALDLLEKRGYLKNVSVLRHGYEWRGRVLAEGALSDINDIDAKDSSTSPI